jgi:hypothetical protein
MKAQEIKIEYFVKGISGLAIDKNGDLWQIEYGEKNAAVGAEKLKKTTGTNKGQYSVRIKDEQGRFQTYLKEWIDRHKIPYKVTLVLNE